MVDKKLKRNGPKKSKAKKTPASGKGVNNSKTAGKKKGPSVKKKGPAPGKPVPKPSKKAPDSIRLPVPLQGRTLKEFFASAPKTTGVLKRPTYREQQFEWNVTIGVEDAKRETLKPLMDYPGGQHVVALFFPISDISEWPGWEQFDTGQMLQSAHGSDFHKTFEVSTSFMSETLGVSDRRLQQLGKMGIAVKFGRGRWDYTATVKGYLKYIKDEFQGRGGEEYSKHRTRKMRIGADREAVKLAQDNEELGYIEDFKEEQKELSLDIRNALELIPEEVAEKISGKPVHIVKKELTKEIKKALEQLSVQAMDPDVHDRRRTRTGTRKKAS